MARIDRDGNIVRDLENPATAPAPLLNPTASTSPSSFAMFSSFLPATFKTATVSKQLLMLQFIFFLLSCFLPPAGYFYPSELALLRIGSDNASFILCSACGYLLELRRLILPVFLHYGLVHLIMNSFFQILICPDFESLLGTKPFLTLFLGSGLFGNLCFATYGASAVGASGACFGLVGASAMRLYILWPTMDSQVRDQAKANMIRQAAILLFLELLSWNSTAHGAHLGGLVSGACIYAVLTCTESSPRDVVIRTYCKAALIFMTLLTTTVIFYPAVADFNTTALQCKTLMSIYS